MLCPPHPAVGRPRPHGLEVVGAGLEPRLATAWPCDLRELTLLPWAVPPFLKWALLAVPQWNGVQGQNTPHWAWLAVSMVWEMLLPVWESGGPTSPYSTPQPFWWALSSMYLPLSLGFLICKNGGSTELGWEGRGHLGLDRQDCPAAPQALWSQAVGGRTVIAMNGQL